MDLSSLPTTTEAPRPPVHKVVARASFEQKEGMDIESNPKKRKWEEDTRIQPFAKKIRLDVGGTLYTTSWDTIAGPGKERTMLSAMFSGKYKLEDDNGAYFLDRDGAPFIYILNYLRDGDVVLPQSEELRARLLQEARYFGVQGLINKLNGSFLKWDLLNKHKSVTIEGNHASSTADCKDVVVLVTGFVDTCRFRVGNGATCSVEFGVVGKHFNSFGGDPQSLKNCWVYSHVGEIFLESVQDLVERATSIVRGDFGLDLDLETKQLSFFVENQCQATIQLPHIDVVPFISFFDTGSTVELLTC